MCPAVMLAKSRTISTNGLVNTPIISTIGMIGSGTLSHQGTPGVLTMSFQYSFLPENWVTKNVNRARIPVTAMFPVRLAPPGKMGIRPIRLLKSMKKKSVSRNGVYFGAFFPKEGSMTSSCKKTITGSSNACKPLGAWSGRRLYCLATDRNIHVMRISEIISAQTFFVMEISNLHTWSTG